ncbi:MAG: hypothetical protein IIV21_05830, partial [Bacteroidales bacterium]|nr:hypothetical protein [Bacteroidales bacterium]
MKEKYNSCELQRIDSLYDKITTLIEQARNSKIVNSVYEINHSSHTKSQQHHFNLSWSHYLILMRI